MRKTILISFILLVLVLGILTFSLYSFPIFLDLNPFYSKEFLEDDDGIYRKSYSRYSLSPLVLVDVPEGWNVKTKVYEEIFYLATEIPESERYEGLLSVEIYKEDELMGSLSYVGDTGGSGGTYINFPDSNPEIYESMLKASLDESNNIYVKSVNEGEYSKFELFGEEVRRVGHFYVPNINKEDVYYFTNPLDPVLFYFEENGPQYDFYFNNKKDNEHVSEYDISILADNPSEEDLVIVDSILGSISLR